MLILTTSTSSKTPTLTVQTRWRRWNEIVFKIVILYMVGVFSYCGLFFYFQLVFFQHALWAPVRVPHPISILHSLKKVRKETLVFLPSNDCCLDILRCRLYMFFSSSPLPHCTLRHCIGTYALYEYIPTHVYTCICVNDGDVWIKVLRFLLRFCYQ